MSNILKNLTDKLEKLPGIGKKSAVKMTYHIVSMSKEEADDLVEAITLVKENIKKCKLCGYYSDGDLCEICKSPARDRSKLMIVSTVRDIEAFENTSYNGLYFIITTPEVKPKNDIGISMMDVDKFADRLRDTDVEEVILAIPNHSDADVTAGYLASIAKQMGKHVTRISHGIPLGGLVEYFDKETLNLSIIDRREVD